MPRVIFHIDMDAFFASVEQRENPELRGKPVIVGSPPDRRGVVCAASYEARKYGVRSALPSRTAGRLCPDGIFIRPRIDLYRAESEKIMAIIARPGATLQQISVDEAYMELPQSDPEQDPDDALLASVTIAKEIKARILQERNLTASIGIAANKFLAKVGSDFQKPDGMTLIPERDKVQFLRPLPVGAIPGVGKVTAEALAHAGLKLIADLQDTSRDLRALVGSFGPVLRDLAFGIDDRPLDTSDEPKSISSETTFLHDTEDRPQLRATLWEHAGDIASKLEQYGLGAFTVQVKVRYGDFTTLTRQISVQDPLTDRREIYRLACYVLAKEKLVRRPLRLLGLGVSGLSKPSSQLRLPFGV